MYFWQPGMGWHFRWVSSSKRDRPSLTFMVEKRRCTWQWQWYLIDELPSYLWNKWCNFCISFIVCYSLCKAPITVIPHLIVAWLYSEEDYKVNHRRAHKIVSRSCVETMVTPYHLQLTNGWYPPHVEFVRALEIGVGWLISVTFLPSLNLIYRIVAGPLSEVLR